VAVHWYHGGGDLVSTEFELVDLLNRGVLKHNSCLHV
jgi:hypothetical protein